jgi:hypothetical protein
MKRKENHEGASRLFFYDIDVYFRIYVKINDGHGKIYYILKFKY